MNDNALNYDRVRRGLDPRQKRSPSPSVADRRSLTPRRNSDQDMDSSRGGYSRDLEWNWSKSNKEYKGRFNKPTLMFLMGFAATLGPAVFFALFGWYGHLLKDRMLFTGMVFWLVLAKCSAVLITMLFDRWFFRCIGSYNFTALRLGIPTITLAACTCALPHLRTSESVLIVGGVLGVAAGFAITSAYQIAGGFGKGTTTRQAAYGTVASRLGCAVFVLFFNFHATSSMFEAELLCYTIGVLQLITYLYVLYCSQYDEEVIGIAAKHFSHDVYAEDDVNAGKRSRCRFIVENFFPQYDDFVTSSTYILQAVLWLQSLFVHPFFPFLDGFKSALQLVMLTYGMDVLARIFVHFTEMHLAHVTSRPTLPLSVLGTMILFRFAFVAPFLCTVLKVYAFEKWVIFLTMGIFFCTGYYANSEITVLAADSAHEQWRVVNIMRTHMFVSFGFQLVGIFLGAITLYDAFPDDSVATELGSALTY